jgi:hypothetical protein
MGCLADLGYVHLLPRGNGEHPIHKYGFDPQALSIVMIVRRSTRNPSAHRCRIKNAYLSDHLERASKRGVNA